MVKLSRDFSYWTQRDGTPILLKDMETSHIQNALAMVRDRTLPRAEQRMKEFPHIPKLYDKYNISHGYFAEWAKRFEQELESRGVK